MAHKFNSGLFVGQPAWHGLGTVLQNAPSIKEALGLAGLDWKVEALPAYVSDGLGQDGKPVLTRVPECQVIRRATDKKIFAHMGKIYTPLQNDAALGVFQPLLDSGLCTIEAAGSLDEGRKIWILAKVHDGMADVIPGDAVQKYVLLAHSHDGSLRIVFGDTDVRVVCWNTLMAALDSGDLIFRKHTKNALVDIEQMVAAFGVIKKGFAANIEKYRFLAKKQCTDAGMLDFARTLLGGAERAADPDATIKNVDDMVSKFHEGIAAQEPGVRGTMWGAFNAATEYVTHDAGRSADTRQASNWFGPGAKRTSAALDLAVAFAEKAPDAVSLARECWSNDASASAEFNALLGMTPAAPAEKSEFARLLEQPAVAAE